MTAAGGATQEKPAAADGQAKPSDAPQEDTDMTAADADAPAKEGDSKTDSPTKTDYQMSVKTDEKSAAVSDSQAGNASTHEATTEVKAAAQVKEGSSTDSSPADVGKLDVHLTYLWEVHRVNFYVGGDAPQMCFLTWQAAWLPANGPLIVNGNHPLAMQATSISSF